MALALKISQTQVLYFDYVDLLYSGVYKMVVWGGAGVVYGQPGPAGSNIRSLSMVAYGGT